MRFIGLLLALPALLLLTAAEVPSRPDVGSPELAFLGPSSVGLRTVRLVNPGQVDPLLSAEAGHVVRSDRTLPLSIWYPAKVTGRETVEPYRGALISEPPRPPTAFHIPAMAVRNAAPSGGGYPIVLVSHGYNNDPAMLSWLTENLASKGYVVVAIGHNDPPITEPAKAPAALLQRPLDIAFVLHEIRSGLLGTLADPQRIALVGYSMGGYGVLTSAGATLSAKSPALKILPQSLTERYVAGGADASGLNGGDLKAVVAISPAGGAPWSVWGDGVTGVRVPLMVIAGDADRKVGFEHGPAEVFADAVHSERYMLVFRGAGHSIGVDPAPPEMHSNLWDLDWFEDAIWRKDRVNAISLHFITAFLDLYVKGDRSRAAYLNVPKPDSDDTTWVGPASPYGAISQGGDNPTWKGFARDHQNGLIFRHLAAAP
jgi:predicted dienelactone hydrolase